MPIKADKSLRAYYNEIDPYAAQWIRNLMAEGWITKGDVDERSIEDVRPNELSGYDRLHFFAGVAVWDYALNQAGWGRSEIWTGSCPCQPFSAAGKGAGFDDQRHLWPAFHHLIQECRPAIVLGEQVASKDADPWINLVQVDVEALGYGFGAAPFPAASVGAPHIRDRLYWVADTELQQRPSRESGVGPEHDAGGREQGAAAPAGLCGDRGMAHAQHNGCDRQESHQAKPNGNRENIELLDRDHFAPQGQPAPGPVNGFWADADWLYCRDGKWRPVDPGTFPLVDGPAGGMGRVRTDWHTPAGKEGFGHRAGRLKGYGNAICAEAARVFIECVMEGRA